MKINKSISRIYSFLFTALLITLFSLNLSAQNSTITIAGTVKFDNPNNKMQVVKREGPNKIVVAEFDTDKNRTFSFTMDVKEPGIYTLNCKNAESIQFWAEDEDVFVNFRGVDTSKIQIKNPLYHLIERSGPKNELMNHINFLINRHYQGQIAISQMANNAKFENDSEQKAFTNSGYEFFATDINARYSQLADMYYNRTSAVALLNYLNSATNSKQIAKITSAINSTNPNYPPLVKFTKEKAEKEANIERVKIGALAPDFSFPSPSGEKIGPSNFTGKVLLIDFWASWCGPCRSEIPNLKKIYEKYKGRGVEFLSVSIDKGNNEWEKALKEESMTWAQVLAPNAGKELMQLYQFNMIPFIILIDQKGHIVAKHLRGTEIEIQIKNLLK